MMLGFSVGANAACDIKSLKGIYSVGVGGTNGNQVCAGIGVADFDGKGTVTINYTAACGSQKPANASAALTYVVNGQCVVFTDFNASSVMVASFDKQLKVGTAMVSGIGDGLVTGTLIKK